MKGKKLKLDEVVKEVSKKYGAESIISVEEREKMQINTISTGCYSFDRLFGCGGLPQGRIIDLYGEYSSGKSTLALYLIGQAQKKGGKAMYIDAEFSFSSNYAKQLGVNLKDLLLVQPTYGEEALDILERTINTNEVDIIVVDSTAALVPRKELEGDIEECNVALQARMLGKSLRMITGPASKTKTIIIFISQVRQKIGMFFGPSTDSTGGKALKFYASVRLEVKKIKTLKDNEEVIGNKLLITATKNKVGKPFRKAEIDLFFDTGLDIIGDIVNICEKNNIIKKTGNTYFYGDIKLGVGKEATRDFLIENKNIFNKIKKELS